MDEMERYLSSATIPSVISGYSITERIGRGTFSVVYKGVYCTSNLNGMRGTVAIKCLDMGKACSSKFISDCVITEVKMLKHLRHNNIVRLLDFQWDKKNVYLIMEYCRGGDLASFIALHGAIPEAITRRFFRQLASAMQYMHAMSIAHMDLKPQNILLTNQTQLIIKVSDFGLSQYLKSDEYRSSFRGSPLYMAPEIFNRAHYDNRVDLWSAGVILHECLYGRAPFATDSYVKVVEMIRSKDSIKLPSTIRLSYDCIDMLTGLLVRDPNKRIQFESFFTHPFINLRKNATLGDIKRAEEFIKKGERLKKTNNFLDAMKYITNGIQLYINSLHLVDEKSKTSFRLIIRENLDTAEQLKLQLQADQTEPLPYLGKGVVDLWSGYPQVKAAMLIAQAARELEIRERWPEALEKYTLAIEGAMSILSQEKLSERALILRKRISNWLDSAESIEIHMDVMRDPFDLVSGSTDGEVDKMVRELVSKDK